MTRKSRAIEEVAFVADLTKVKTTSQIVVMRLKATTGAGSMQQVASDHVASACSFGHTVARPTDQNGVDVTIEAEKSQELDALQQRLWTAFD
ncbi:hypothetical protein A4U53_000600 (plasmid) [Rhizobium ruizarguesonis]|uniref:Uncharacterized protein n=2 Tax=Rhizobium TaxID=379 RepID=A0A179B8H5_RHILE|nr:hypothetical protein [Rhizobium leguminosarum]OAP87976.1 hypothetical protein A4U53_36180 [Rhizobium leguminosarum]